MTMSITATPASDDGSLGENNNKRPRPPTAELTTLHPPVPAGQAPGLPPAGADPAAWQWEQHQKHAAAAATMLLPPPQTEATPLEPLSIAGTQGPPSNTQYTELVKAESSDCSFCGEVISDRYIFQVASRSWHSHCLRCCVCASVLDSHSTCFLKEDQLYCKADYTKLFGAKCFKCCRPVSPTDWVRKARDQVYHLACFACDACKRQLSTGEEFGISENKVLCKSHYMETVDGACTSSDESGESDAASKKKTKRMRTTFTEDQIQILQANFQIDSNPDGQDLERIAQITGLSKRVTQVWFQNCRARQKKYMNNSSKARGAAKSSSVPLSGLSPIPRDQCSTPHQLDLHVMYSTFRAQQPPGPPGPPGQAANATNTDGEEMSQDSNPGGFVPRGEV